MKAKKGTTYDAVRQLGMAMKDVEESTSYRTPALKVKKKLLVRLKEDGESLVVRMGFDDREILMRANSRAFYITDHYRDYPAVLVHLGEVNADQLSDLLNISYRYVTSKRAR